MGKTRNYFEQIRKSEIFYPILILIGIAAIAYLPFIGHQGFYRDDWYQIWAGTTQGSYTLIKMFSIDRPALGVLYAITHKLLGSNLISWHLFAFITRVFISLLFYWLIQILWPKQKIPCLIMASLFIVYPGYLEQPFADTSINLFIAVGLSLFSITMSIYAFLSNKALQKIIFVILSVITGFFYLVLFEYLMGMEIVRICLIFFIDQKNHKVSKSPNEVKGIIKQLIPYFLMLILFMVWRLLVFKNARVTTDVGRIISLYSADPLNMVLRIISNCVSGIYNTIIQAWAVPLYNLGLKLTEKEFVVIFLISIISAIGFFYYLSKNKTNFEDRFWAKDAVLIGLMVVIFVSLPMILLDRKINFEYTYDHYTFPLIFGVVLFIVGLIYLIEMKSNIRLIIMTGLFAVAIFTQYANGVYYNKFWEMQRTLWWQLSWRAPNIKDNTTLVVFTPQLFQLRESYEVWAPANMIYHPELGPLKIAAEVPNMETLPLMLFQKTVGRHVRRVEFTIDFKQMLVLSMPGSGVCMHVIDGSKSELSNYEDPAVRSLHPFSRASLIATEGENHQPLVGIFGQEPVHDWCYFFQKASLARQREDWQEIIKLGVEVNKLGLRPMDLSEWMPFYEGFAKGHRVDLANEVGALIRNEQAFVWQFCAPYINTDWSKEDKMNAYFITNICGA